MLVSKFYLEGKDVRMNEVNGSVRLQPAAGPLDTFDGENLLCTEPGIVQCRA